MTCLCGMHETQEDHNIEEFNNLSYLIIKNSIAYYCPERVSFQPVLDDQYDQFELRYLQLCEILGKPNELVHKEYPDVPEHLNGKGMIEIDWNHPLVKEVYSKIHALKGNKTNKTRR